jgi:uncharacterized protein (TIGR04206 family)
VTDADERGAVASRTDADGPGDRSDAPGGGHAGRTSTRAALAAVALLGTVPVSVQTFSSPGTGVSVVFPWGLFNTAPPHVTTVLDFLFVHTSGLPEFILAWPLSVGLWLLALGSAALGVAVGREDVRVTAFLLVFSGVAGLGVSTGFSVQPYRTGYPVGPLATWLVAWWFYAPAVRERLPV